MRGVVLVFSEEVVEAAWRRSGGYCECRRKTHEHSYTRCNKQLVKANSGRAGRGCWEAHHLDASRGDSLSNCQILCWDYHSRTL